jgi:Outer membrane protein beta-barrel domain
MKNRSKSAALSIALLALPFAHTAAAEERPRPALELAAGALLFADDGVVKEGFVGGTVRLYVLPRISVGPEIAFIQGERHHHVMLTGNVTFDFVDPLSGGQLRSVTPYAVVGTGLFQTKQQFPNNDTFTSSEGAFTAGGGVRARVGKTVTVGAEARVGWELHLRVNGTIGIQLGK